MRTFISIDKSSNLQHEKVLIFFYISFIIILCRTQSIISIHLYLLYPFDILIIVFHITAIAVIIR